MWTRNSKRHVLGVDRERPTVGPRKSWSVKISNLTGLAGRTPADGFGVITENLVGVFEWGFISGNRALFRRKSDWQGFLRWRPVLIRFQGVGRKDSPRVTKLSSTSWSVEIGSYLLR